MLLVNPFCPVSMDFHQINPLMPEHKEGLVSQAEHLMVVSLRDMIVAAAPVDVKSPSAAEEHYDAVRPILRVAVDKVFTSKEHLDRVAQLGNRAFGFYRPLPMVDDPTYYGYLCSGRHWDKVKLLRIMDGFEPHQWFGSLASRTLVNFSSYGKANGNEPEDAIAS